MFYFTPRCDILTEEISYGKLYRLLLTGYSRAIFNLSKMKKGTGYRNKLTVVHSYITLDTQCVFKGTVPREFWLLFSSWIIFPWAPHNIISPIFDFKKNLFYKNICNPRCTASVVDASSELTTSIIDNYAKFNLPRCRWQHDSIGHIFPRNQAIRLTKN